ncbi:MAG: phosphonopyruvate decarboxylase, partial [Fretibacterium sp.]|nr:phosphonopyruvate decarboxylase [Fretibacterium sp.]
CVDGDGAALMHLGALAVIGTSAPKNLIHIIINNSAHESVGGMPTAAGGVDLAAVARACGYPRAVSVADFDGLDRELGAAVRREGPSLIEARCAIGARANLGRPTTTALENKRSFMQYLDA